MKDFQMLNPEFLTDMVIFSALGFWVIAGVWIVRGILGR